MDQGLMHTGYFNQESERLEYRALTKEDVYSWLEFFENNDRLHFLGLDTNKPVMELAQDWIEKQLERYENQGLGLLAVIEKDSLNLIGMCGIIPRELDGKNELEIGYSFKPKYWGKGYATEAASHMKRFGLKNGITNRFISIIHKDNQDSMRVAMKNGMSPLRDSEFMGMPVIIYSL